MSYNNNYPPPPGQFQPQQPIQQQQASGSGWVDNRTVIGGWFASQNGMQTGKYIEYKVMSQPTQRGGVFKSVKFFKPFQKKNGQMGESDSFSFNQMKELVEKINHFMNTYTEERGFFVWQSSAPTQGMGQPPAPQQYPPQQFAQAPQYPQGQFAPPPQQQQFAPPPPAFGAPQYPQQQAPAPAQQPMFPGPGGNVGGGGTNWP